MLQYDRIVKDQGNGIKFHSTQVKYIEEEKLNADAIKQDNKDNLTVTVNGVLYDCDGTSIKYMSAVMALANFQYNQAVAAGTAPATAYDAVYKSTIGWKGADEVIHTVQVESVAEALQLAMGEIANLLGA